VKAVAADTAFHHRWKIPSRLQRARASGRSLGIPSVLRMFSLPPPLTLTARPTVVAQTVPRFEILLCAAQSEHHPPKRQRVDPRTAVVSRRASRESWKDLATDRLQVSC